MTDKSRHKDHKKFFSKVDIPYSETKAEIWNKLSDQIDLKERRSSISLKPGKRYLWYATAACVSLIIGISIFIRFYSVEMNVPGGQHLATNLPDGSKVHLNAETRLSYKPYWWRFSRELKLEGEAFFKVNKGKKFSVRSEFGTTSVSGTSFNARLKNG